MILFQVLKAYQSIEELMDYELDYKSAYALVKVKRELKDHVDFYLDEEMKLVQAYGKKGANGIVSFTSDGRFDLDNVDSAKLYNEKRLELGNLEISPEIKKVTIKAPSIMKASMIEALEDIVEFDDAEQMK